MQICDTPRMVTLSLDKCVFTKPAKEGQVVKKGDLLVKINPDLYTRGSQRCAMSRYIGIGTYDTTKMEKGKL